MVVTLPIVPGEIRTDWENSLESAPAAAQVKPPRFSIPIPNRARESRRVGRRLLLTYSFPTPSLATARDSFKLFHP